MSAVLQAADFLPFERTALEGSIVRRFEAQVAHAPQRLAVKSGQTSLSYIELNHAANRIARAILAARGSRSEPVAIVVEQGCTLIAAILGALKAGKIYVPLEASLPRERLEYMLRDSTAPLALAGASALRVLRGVAPPALDVIDIENLAPTGSVADPGIDVPAEACAYIYYTTGTTGQPKGVVDTHRNVLHNILRYTNGLRVTSDDRLTLLQSASFSGAVSSMFTALLNGAALFPFDVRGSTADTLADYLERERITIYHSVPSIFRSFLRGGRVFPEVRCVRLEGDQASTMDVELLRRHFGRDCVLANGLGTTETGLVCRFVVSGDTALEGGILPVGYPVEDIEVFIADERGMPAAPGVTGEIAVRSEYLACGYWNRPDATSRAFLSDPGVSPKKIYRTGDLGRMRPDGCLEHLGRIDSLVKIRGMTVALAEVEAALQRLPSIQEAAAAAWPDGRGGQRLIAYYVPAAGAAPTVTELRQQLAALHPSALIPAAYVRLERLPLNENLKIDRSRLPAPSRERPLLHQPCVGPRDPTEALLVRIWEQLLEVKPVGVHDDFFDLGGDSLIAMQMAAAVAAATGVDLPPSVLLTASTIEHVARTLASNRAHSAIVPIQPAGEKEPFYFVHGDYLGGGLYCRELARELGPDQPFFAVTPCGLDGEVAPASIEEMAERHLRALRAHDPHGPYVLGGNCNGGIIALEMAQRLVAAGAVVMQLILIRTSARNARYAPLRSMVERTGRWLGISIAAQRRLIRRLRWFAEAWNSAPPAGRVGVLAGKVGALLQLPFRRQPAHTEAAVQSNRERPADPDTLISTFMGAAADYVPLPYPGSIIVFWPELEPESAEEALAYWRKVSPSATIETVPGDHLTAVTVHAGSFARRLAAQLSSLPK